MIYNKLNLILNFAFVQNNRNGIVLQAEVFDGLTNLIQQELLLNSIKYN